MEAVDLNGLPMHRCVRIAHSRIGSVLWGTQWARCWEHPRAWAPSCRRQDTPGALRGTLPLSSCGKGTAGVASSPGDCAWAWWFASSRQPMARKHTCAGRKSRWSSGPIVIRCLGNGCFPTLSSPGRMLNCLQSHADPNPRCARLRPHDTRPGRQGPGAATHPRKPEFASVFLHAVSRKLHAYDRASLLTEIHAALDTKAV